MRKKTIITVISIISIISLMACNKADTEPVTSESVATVVPAEPTPTPESVNEQDTNNIESESTDDSNQDGEVSDSENFETLEELFNVPDMREAFESGLASMEDETLSVSYDVKDNNLIMTFKILDSSLITDDMAEGLAKSMEEQPDKFKSQAAQFDEILGFEAGTCTVTMRFTDSDGNVLAEQTFRNEPVEESKETQEEFDVTPLDKIMYAQNAVNLRSGPSTDYETVGSLALNQEIHVIGQASTGWYRIEFNGDTPFVSNNYLGDTMVAVSSNNTASDNSNNNNSTPDGDKILPNGQKLSDFLKEHPNSDVDLNVPMQHDEWFHGDYTGGENYHAY